MRFTVYLIFIFVIFTEFTYARPVSYPGGWTVMLKNDGNINEYVIGSASVLEQVRTP